MNFNLIFLKFSLLFPIFTIIYYHFYHDTLWFLPWNFTAIALQFYWFFSDILCVLARSLMGWRLLDLWWGQDWLILNGVGEDSWNILCDDTYNENKYSVCPKRNSLKKLFFISLLKDVFAVTNLPEKLSAYIMAWQFKSVNNHKIKKSLTYRKINLYIQFLLNDLKSIWKW